MSEQKETPKQEQTKAVATQNAHLIPHDLVEARAISSVLAASDAIPKDFIGKPANVLLAVMHGAEVGLSPAQSLSSIMVVNSRASIWGDALLGIVKASSVYEWSKDGYDAAVENGTAWFEVKRKNEEPLRRTFSMDDAKRANLAGKPGPWQNYPKRMLYMRARAFALRDAFPDLLNGLSVAEEMQDTIPGEIVQQPTEQQQAQDKIAVESAKEKLAPKPKAAPKPEPKEDIQDAEVVEQEQPKQEAVKPAPEPAVAPPAAKPGKKVNPWG